MPLQCPVCGVAQWMLLHSKNTQSGREAEFIAARASDDVEACRATSGCRTNLNLRGIPNEIFEHLPKNSDYKPLMFTHDAQA